MTATRLRNPIILQPQTKLRSEIWRYQKQLAESRQQQVKARKVVYSTPLAEEDDSWGGNFLERGDLDNKREQDVQHQLAADRIPTVPALSTTSLYQALISWSVSPERRLSPYSSMHAHHPFLLQSSSVRSFKFHQTLCQVFARGNFWASCTPFHDLLALLDLRKSLSLQTTTPPMQAFKSSLQSKWCAHKAEGIEVPICTAAGVK